MEVGHGGSLKLCACLVLSDQSKLASFLTFRVLRHVLERRHCQLCFRFCFCFFDWYHGFRICLFVCLTGIIHMLLG